MITAELTDIRPIYDPQHPYSEPRVQAILDGLTVGTDEYGDPIYREWDLPPVVVIEDEGNGHPVLDGHHRLEAASRLHRHGHISTIPAWVVSVADYCRLLEDKFDGTAPSRLVDLREYIRCGDVTANEVAGHGDDVINY